MVFFRRQLVELDHLASHDALTGLLNRAGFRRRLEARDACAVVLVELEHADAVGELLGTAHADELRREVARRLATHDAGRLAENEFALLLPGTERVDLGAIADALAKPFAFDGIELAVDARLGAAMYPAHGLDADEVLENARLALDHAKRIGSRAQLYNESLQADHLARLLLAAELREAIRAGDIVVQYQPQVALESGHVCGVEALVRWEHPEHGLITAAEFIELAEQSTVVSELGRHVLATSIAQWRRWCDDGIELDIAVNLSAIDLLDVTLPGTIIDLLLEHQMPADRLVLELTERTFLGDDGRSDRVLRELESIGVGLAIDDFGTGYASLTALRKLPITHIKLDRSLSDDRIVAGTIALAHALGARVVAEGVETEAQLRRLTLLDCDSIQGYLVGRAQTARVLTTKLSAGRRRVPVRRS